MPVTHIEEAEQVGKQFVQCDSSLVTCWAACAPALFIQLSASKMRTIESDALL